MSRFFPMFSSLLLCVLSVPHAVRAQSTAPILMVGPAIDEVTRPGAETSVEAANLIRIVWNEEPAFSSDQETGVESTLEQGGGIFLYGIPPGLHPRTETLKAVFGNGLAEEPEVAPEPRWRGRRGSPPVADSFPIVILDAQHPVTRGLSGFRVEGNLPRLGEIRPEWRVLLAGETPAGRVPLAWVGQVGRGRFLATLLGRTAAERESESFRQLFSNGIGWLSGGNESGLPEPRLIQAIQPSLEEQVPEPLSPQDSMKHIHLPEGFEVELFASEPEVVKPIALAFDEAGRAWVAESVDYPNRPLPEGEGNDRIKICEDTDGDGRADKFTVFAEGLNIPTGLVLSNGGALVAAAPYILFLKDTDGDDVADVRKVVFEGFGKFDTHAVHSNFAYGFDNWIWASIGYSGARVPVGDSTREFRQGLFRFEPDGSDLEFLTQTTNNTWGLGLNETLDVFASTANGQHSVHMAFPNAVYERVLGWHGNGSAGIEDHKFFHPIARYRQVDNIGRFTAAAGHRVYTARAFPRSYWNRMAFVCEPTGHLVHQNILREEGGGFAAGDGWNLFVSSDEWTAPVAAEVGPDGAVWILDWYNWIIRHNPTPPGFETGVGNAYETGMRDKSHGRIYRVVPHDRSRLSKPRDLRHATPQDLVETLSDDNLFWRLTAQRLLVERHDMDILPALRERVADVRRTDTGQAPAAMHALWTMEGLGVFEGSSIDAVGIAEKALEHPAAEVRRTALRVLPREARTVERILHSGVLFDPTPRVRRDALVALGEMPPSKQAGIHLYQALRAARDSADPWLRDAATSAAARHDVGFLERALLTLRAQSEVPAAKQEPVNLLPNGSFEQTEKGTFVAWSPAIHSGSAEFFLSEDARTGGLSAGVRSASGADASWLTWIAVEPQSRYRFSGWIKTENLVRKGNGKGALLNIHNIQPLQTPALEGTNYWKRVEVTFETGSLKEVGLNALLGGWGQATGTALYDDLVLERIADRHPLEDILEVVTSHYARRGAQEGILETLSGLGEIGPEASEGWLAGLVKGWPEGKGPRLSAGEEAALQGLFGRFSERGQTEYLRLLARWGRADLLASEFSATIRQQRDRMKDADLPEVSRYEAALSLQSLADTRDTVSALISLLEPQESPSLQAGVLAVLSQSRVEEIGPELVKKWRRLTPAVRAGAIDLFLRRPPWIGGLVEALETGKVSSSDFSVLQARQLEETASPELADRVRKVLEGKGARLSSQEREQMVARFLPLAEKKGDVQVGKVVFEENCSKCHRFGGKGALVGPDLTGFGKNERTAILLEILDPNRSVEGTYRQWNLTTHEGHLFSGRLMAESRNAIELLAAGDEKVLIPRDEIEDLSMSSLSVMPEGFESLGEIALASLLDYLQNEGGIAPQ